MERDTSRKENLLSFDSWLGGQEIWKPGMVCFGLAQGETPSIELFPSVKKGSLFFPFIKP